MLFWINKHTYTKLFIEFIGNNNEKDNKLVHSNVTQLLEFQIFPLLKGLQNKKRRSNSYRNQLVINDHNI